MIVPDVNLLIYAHLPEAKQHAAARDWMEQTLSGVDTVGFPDIVVHSFLRLTTDVRILSQPASVSRSVEAVNEWLAQSSASLLHAGPDHWQILQDLLRATGVRGSDVSDAVLAAIALEHDAVVHTTDRDFARFPGLKWKNPLE